jgi:phage tail-like protein
MQPAEVERLLPDIIARTVRPDAPLGAVLDVMADMHAPSEAVLSQLDAYFDPHRAPDRFVPFLARWVDLEWLLAGVADERPMALTGEFPPGTGWLRELVAASVQLSQWRGTAAGLIRFLETATGCAGFEILERTVGPAGTFQPFHLRVVAPPEARVYQPLIEQVIDSQKPAYVTSELSFRAAEGPDV